VKSDELFGRVVGFSAEKFGVERTAAEEEFIKRNTFQLTYEPFDWRLNDLTGGRPD